MKSKARITAIGYYVPQKILRNADLEQMVDTSDEWIVQRTGIRERRIAEADQFTSDLCIAAIEHMCQQYGKTVHDVDMIIVGTSTPDYFFPSTAARIQARFGIAHTGAIDIQAACAGFTYSLHLANALISSGLHHKVLVVGADVLSKITDYKDRTTCILFGDGAGAVLVERDEHQPSFIASHLGTQGEGGLHLYRTALAAKMDGKNLEQTGYLVQNGREVYKWAVTTVPAGMQALLEKAGMEQTEVDWFVPHSANLRMIESICERSGFPLERTLYSMEYFGNTSSASIPLALQMASEQNKIHSGETLMLYGFGGGLVHAGLLLTWNPA